MKEGRKKNGRRKWRCHQFHIPGCLSWFRSIVRFPPFGPQSFIEHLVCAKCPPERQKVEANRSAQTWVDEFCLGLRKLCSWDSFEEEACELEGLRILWDLNPPVLTLISLLENLNLKNTLHSVCEIHVAPQTWNRGLPCHNPRERCLWLALM